MTDERQSLDQQSKSEERKITDTKNLFPTPAQMNGEEPLSESTKEIENENEKDPIQLAYEESAKKIGWIPPEEYKGDKPKEELISAKEYLEANPLSNKLKSLKDDNKELKRTNDTIIKMLQQQTEKYALEQAKEIQQQKYAAIQEGDVEKTEELQEKYNKVIEEAHRNTAQSSSDEAKYREFATENAKWWDKNKQMTNEASELEAELRENRKNLSIDERLLIVKSTMMWKYPNYFIGNIHTENPNRSKASVVEGKTASTPLKNQVTFNDLPYEAKTIVKNMLKTIQSKLSTEEYYKKLDDHAKQLVETGAISINR
jgi:hypothetical protein